MFRKKNKQSAATQEDCETIDQILSLCRNLNQDEVNIINALSIFLIRLILIKYFYLRIKKY